MPETPAFGPVAGMRMTDAYARMVARNAYFWAWPMINIWNKRLAFARAPEPGKLGGVMPCAPLNRLAMLSDYVEPMEHYVACPNQDVVYGGGALALDQGPAVVQVPDFGKRFWMYQAVDLRTDSFADLGAMYGTEPGFYMFVGPGWNGPVPRGIAKVFRSTTSTGFLLPRVFLDDTAEDRRLVQEVIGGIEMYPIAEFDGIMKRRDWRSIPSFPAVVAALSQEEAHWVFPEKFLEQLPFVLRDARPMRGEESRYAEAAVMIAAAEDPAIGSAIIDECRRAETEVVGPLLQFRNFGIQLPHYWTTTTNGAEFGTDYYTRTAVAKSNILVNRPNEAKYFYQDYDARGSRLNARKKYTVTFKKGELPPVKGFWSLTLYNEQHFFESNAIRRYSVGTKNKDLETHGDGSLTIYVQADEPGDPLQRANWLPSPRGRDFCLFLRAYWAEPAILNGRWTPPGVEVAA